MSRALALVLFGLLPLSAFGQSVDPLIGTWKFNPEKSTSVGHSYYRVVAFGRQ
jgi:hypothetical protein